MTTKSAMESLYKNIDKIPGNIFYSDLISTQIILYGALGGGLGRGPRFSRMAQPGSKGLQISYKYLQDWRKL